MPTLSRPDAPAGAASTTATRPARRRVASLGTNNSDLSGTEGFDRAPEAVFELHLRLPAEHLARARDVGLAHVRVVDREGLEDDLALGARDPDDRLGELEQRHLGRVAKVDRQVL